jgi:hypothetical protein
LLDAFNQGTIGELCIASRTAGKAANTATETTTVIRNDADNRPVKLLVAAEEAETSDLVLDATETVN